MEIQNGVKNGMKVTLNKIQTGEEEIIVNYKNLTPELSELLHKLSLQNTRLTGFAEKGEQMVVFSVEEVLYFESVDGVTYAYLEQAVYRLREKLEELAGQYGALGLVRCSRTMLMNLYKVAFLQSIPGAKLLATMNNQEQILISRKYAGNIREALDKGRR